MLPGDVLVHTAYFCSMWTVLLMERVCRNWRSALSDHRDLWRHLMFVRFPRMRTLLPRLPSPLESYRAICRRQRLAERFNVTQTCICRPPQLGYHLIGPLPPLEAYTFTVEIAKDDGRGMVKNVCSDSLIFDTASINDESPHFAAFRCASRLWNVQPQWFSRLDYATVFRNEDYMITIKTFVTLKNSTGLFYESSVACEVDGAGPQGVLEFEGSHMLVGETESRPRLYLWIALVVHGEEPERCKRSQRIQYGDSETGQVSFCFDNEDENYDGETDPINTEASAVRVLEGYLASHFFGLSYKA